MAHHVDESGCDRLTMRVDFAVSFESPRCTHIRDTISVNRHFAGKGFAAGAVIDHRVANHDVINTWIRRPDGHIPQAQRRKKHAAAPCETRQRAMDNCI